VLAPEAALVVRSGTVLSGSHVGPDGVVAYRELIDELTKGTWRPLREDSFDVTVSAWHGVVLDRYVAERGNLRLDSHEAMVLAVAEGRIVRLFHYIHDPAGFAFFWAD
jgi:ketosteroid isomerase-like protein